MKTRLFVRNFDQQDILDFYSNCEKQTSMSYIQIDGQSRKENEYVSLIFQSRTSPQFLLRTRRNKKVEASNKR